MTIAEQVAASRARQGLPPKVEDPSTIRRLAALLATTNKKAAPLRRSRGAAVREGTRDARSAA